MGRCGQGRPLYRQCPLAGQCGANIRWNLPQIWRAGQPDDAKLLSALAAPGLVSSLEKAVGEPYAYGIDESIDGR